MANPALLLHDLLSRWLVPAKSSIEQVRKAHVQKEAPEIGFWKMQAIAMGYLTEVEAALDFIAPADVAYRPLVPVWAEAVLHPNVHWQHQVGDARQLQPLELGSLLMLGGYLDAIGYTPGLTGEDVTELRAALDAFEKEVLGSDRLLPDVRMYLLRLLRECRAVLDDLTIYGETRFRAVSFELAGAATATAEAARDGGDEDTWERITNAVKQFVLDLGRAYVMSHGLAMLDGVEPQLSIGAGMGGSASKGAEAGAAGGE